VSAARLVAIYVAPAAGEPMEARAHVAVAPGGLDGDRYRLGRGTYSHLPRGPRDVTLVEREVLAALRRDGVDIREDQTRRNLVTEGVALGELVGREFRVGAVRMRGIRPAEPCIALERLTGVANLTTALAHRGGLRAQVLDDGELRVGDPIEID
jgi:MOSC domain-containing protein YiiM